MKKILYTISVAFLVLGCSKGLDPVDNIPVEGQKVTLEFSVPLEMETKGAMAALPTLSDTSKLFVLVFNTSTGALIEAPRATFTTVTGNGVTNKKTYKVDVIMGSTPRALHFLLDAPNHTVVSGASLDETALGYGGNPVMKGDTEAMVWQKLYSSDKQAAYWQRIALPNGIHAYTYLGGQPVHTEGMAPGSYDNGGTTDVLTDDFYYDKHNNKVFQGDYINKQGYKIVDGTGFFACDEVSERVAMVPLVRNFARIKLSAGPNLGLTLTKAVLANVPKYGYVAPYHSAGNAFVANYMTITDGALNLNSSTVRQSGYDAPVPAGANGIDTTPPLESACTNAVNGVVELFTYERSIPTADPTCILVCFNGNKWFKIDVTDDAGNYIPIYRGFDYPMEITSIVGADGYDSIGDAFSNVSLGDVSGSPDTQTLTRVADGKGLNLWVDFIDYTHIGETTPTVILRYKFWHDTASIGNLSSSVTAVVTHKTTPHAITGDAEELEGISYSGTDTQDSASGWYYVSVPLAATGDNIKRSVVRIQGIYNNRKLYRDVTFSVYPTQSLEPISATALTSDAANQETTLSFFLPPSLGSSMFPLVFQIEALNDNLNPASSEKDVPASFGTTLFSGVTGYTKSGQAIYYLKTVNYTEYNSETGTVVQVKLKTIKASGNATTIIVADQKGYFNKATTTLSVQ